MSPRDHNPYLSNEKLINPKRSVNGKQGKSKIIEHNSNVTDLFNIYDDNKQDKNYYDSDRKHKDYDLTGDKSIDENL